MAGIFDPSIFDSGIYDVAGGGGTTYNRTCADSLSTLTETVSRVATYTRTASASLSSITESVAAGLAFFRTVADSLSTLTEMVVRAITFHRTVSQTLGSISESVSRGAMSVTRTVSDAISSVVEYVLDLATPYVAGTAIYVDGTNIAKADGDPVLYASARFTSAVNGVAGTCSFRVRDDTGTMTYLPGQPLELVIDGKRVWTGFVSSAKRVYVFPALNVADFGPTRFFDIEGVDLNILFTKRIAFQQSDPADILAPLYGPNTPDATAISALVDDWLDLSGDAIDISTLVENVGDINEDQNARAWEGSDTWGQAMTSIGLLPAAIFYLDPTRHLVYCDTDTPTAPFGLSDAPNGTTSKGYREMEILLDGTNLANDVMCWGIGYGSSVPVFKRDEDATSQTDHGLWQLGQVTYGVYKQATIDRIADSILNGSPEHHRGAKDDRPAVTLVTHEPGLLPAQKVAFESTVFGWSDVLPIRKMETTFEAPDKPRYELTLSHEIDTPWSFFDPWRFGFPGFPGFHLPPFPPFPMLPSPPNPGGCSLAICGITDTFNRTVGGNSLGTSDAGIGWITFPASSADHNLSVDGSQAQFATVAISGSNANPTSPRATLSLVGAVKPLEMLIDCTLFYDTKNDFSGSTPLGTPTLVFGMMGATVTFGATNTLAPNTLKGQIRFSETGFTDLPATFVDNPVRIRILLDGSSKNLKIWLPSDPEPSTWLITVASGGTAVTDLVVFLSGGWFAGSVTHGNRASLDELTVWSDGVVISRCTNNHFDNFDRVVSNAWGTATAGATWSLQTGAATPSVDGAFGIISATNNQGRIMRATGGDDPWLTGTFTSFTVFRVSAVPTSTGSLVIAVGDEGGGTGVTCTVKNASGGQIQAGASIVAKTDWVANTDYILEMTYDGVSQVQARAYLLSATPPAYMVTNNSASTPTGGWDVSYTNSGTGVTRVASFNYLDFDYIGKPCYLGGPPPAPPSSGVPVIGPGCEVATRIDSTHYQLTRQIQPNTSRVIVGTPGLLYILGTDYTEDTPVTGILEFAAAIDIADPVYCCYIADGLL